MRFLHRIYARSFGYFWLPCPLCGEMFGGHEINYTEAVMRPDGRCLMVCPNKECRMIANIQMWNRIQSFANRRTPEKAE